MYVLRLGLFWASVFIVIGLVLKRSPMMMETSSPTTQWADQPMKLVATPQFGTGKSDIFSTGATHMALLHNAIIRGFNSIYLQAPHVQETDKKDFVGYALAWYRFVKNHHDDEELNLFTKIEAMLQDAEVFKETHAEHDTFMSGLEAYSLYLSSLQSPTTFSGQKLVKIMDSFREAFEHHFHHEITTISALSKHPRAPIEGSPEAKNASSVFKSWGKRTVTKAGATDGVPVFLMNLDRTFEGGLWARWPPMPAPVRWGLTNLAGSWNGGWWLFTSCDSQGQPKQLYALRHLDDE